MGVRYAYGFAGMVESEYIEEETVDGKKKRSEKRRVGYGDALRDLVIVILTNIGHTSFEVSLVKMPGRPFETSFSTGVHFYF